MIINITMYAKDFYFLNIISTTKRIETQRQKDLIFFIEGPVSGNL